MTAETLKPFIAPTSSKNYVTTESSATPSRRHRGSCYFLAITASVITIILTAALLGITIWNTMRISNLQTEVQSLNRVIDSMQKRLGLTYLDDLSDFEKEEENNNALIDDVLPDADGDDDDDDDDNDPENMSGDDEEDLDEDEEDEGDDYDYEELMNKFRHYQETEDDEEETDSADSLGDDNLYDDFEKFNGSKKKQHSERKTRSVTALSSDNENSEEKSLQERTTILRSLKDGHVKSIVAADSYERRRSPLRGNHIRRRKIPFVKSGDSLISAKIQVPSPSDSNEVKPAAHFHFTHKMHPKIHSKQTSAAIFSNISTRFGDVYIGNPNFSNEGNIDNYFHVEHGVVTVHEPGLYYVYAQICYNNNFTQNGFVIFHNEKSFLQCVLHNFIQSQESLINTCHTSGLIYLHRNEHIHIRDFHSRREAFLSDKSDRSFFGLFKIESNVNNVLY